VVYNLSPSPNLGQRQDGVRTALSIPYRSNIGLGLVGSGGGEPGYFVGTRSIHPYQRRAKSTVHTSQASPYDISGTTKRTNPRTVTRAIPAGADNYMFKLRLDSGIAQDDVEQLWCSITARTYMRAPHSVTVSKKSQTSRTSACERAFCGLMSVMSPCDRLGLWRYRRSAGSDVLG
jgi:hypothetical protein